MSKRKKFIVPHPDSENDSDDGEKTNSYHPSTLFKAAKCDSNVQATASSSHQDITILNEQLISKSATSTASSHLEENSLSSARPTISRSKARDMCRVYIEKLTDQQSQTSQPDTSDEISESKFTKNIVKQQDNIVIDKASTSKTLISSSTCILVNMKQKGNPVLKAVRNVPWQYGDIIADYQINPTTCALFLSLRYHKLKPDYIHGRLKELGRAFHLRIILVLVDVKDSHHCIKELSQIAILSDCTLILSWSPEEAGRYLETYKAYENKPPDAIMGKIEKTYRAKVTDFLTSVRSINKTDVTTLLMTFGSVENIIKASADDISLCPGFGPQKARRLHAAFREPFVKNYSLSK